jgi:hypothetical protein
MVSNFSLSTSEMDGESVGCEGLSKDTAFMILKNRRRRDVLRYLHHNEGETTLDTLAEYIAARENDIDESQLSSSQRKRVYIGLYQAHLPKMDDTGVVDFDKHRGTVVLCDEARQLLPYLEHAPDDGVAEPLVYLAVALGLAAVVTSGWAGVYPLSAVPAWTWAIVTAAAIVSVTVHQWRSTRDS